MCTQPAIEAREAVFLLINKKRVAHARLYYYKGSNKIVKHLHGHGLNSFEKNKEELVVVGGVEVFKDSKDLKYPYRYGGLEDPPDTLGLLNTKFYHKANIAWDINATEKKSKIITPSAEESRKLRERLSLRSSESIKKNFSLLNPQPKRIKNLNTVRKFQEHGSQAFQYRSISQTRNSLPVAHLEEIQHQSLDEGENQDSSSASGRPGERSSSLYEVIDVQEDDDEWDKFGSEDDMIPGTRKRKRCYRYKKRKKAVPKRMSAMRVARAAEAKRPDNPFLLKRVCCKKRCFDIIDKSYACEQYKRIMVMDELQERKVLESWLNRDDMNIYFNNLPVCYRFLSIGFRFSNDMIRSVKGTPKSRPRIGGSGRESNRMTKRDSFFVFLTGYADSVGDRMPHINCTMLPDNEKQNVYTSYVDYYTENHQDTIQEPVSSYSYFLRIWKSELSNIKARRTHTFTVCAICEKYRIALIKYVDDPRRREDVINARALHLNNMRMERLGYYRRRDRAAKDPSQYCSFIIDGADQKSYGLPHFAFTTKADKGQKMKIKCVGVLEHRADKKLSLFPMTEEFETGANHVIEAMHRVLDLKYKQEQRLPPTMYVQVDNCSRENKNKYFLSYMEFLVARGVFQEIQVSFLPVGHTHEDIDQAFSVISRHLKTKDAHTMSELIEDIKGAWSKDLIVSQLNSVVNYSRLIDKEKCVRKITGFTKYRYFRFMRNNNEDNTTNYYKTTCSAKVNLRTEWEPLLKDSTEGFLVKVPRLDRTPPYKTKVPQNGAQVLKCFDSVEDRIENETKMTELRNMYERVYNERIDRFHWDLETVFETNVRCLPYENENSDVDEVEEVTERDETVNCNIQRSNMKYARGSFLAVKSSDTAPFWICKVQKFDSEKSLIHVLWFEAHAVNGNKDLFECKYKPLGNYESMIDVDSVHVSFRALNSNGKIGLGVAKALRQVLGMD